MPDQVTERGLRDPRLRERLSLGHASLGSPILLSAEVSEDAPQKSVRSFAARVGFEADEGDERIRTAVRGFAGLCLTTRPRRPGGAW